MLVRDSKSIGCAQHGPGTRQVLTAFVVCSIFVVGYPSFGSLIKMTWDLPRTQTSLSRPKCARKGRREGDNGRDGASPAVCTLPMVPCGSSPAARIYLAKNEATEQEADLGLCCNQMWDACWQRFEPRTQNTVMCVKLSTQASVDFVS